MSDAPVTSAATVAVPASGTQACPLCHTAAPAVRASDGDWNCTTCGQHWSDIALQTAASYALYAATHPAPKRTFTSPRTV